MSDIGPEDKRPSLESEPDSGNANDYFERLGDSIIQPAGEAETYIPQSAIINWLAQQHIEITANLANLRKNRPNFITDPLKRIQYIGAVAMLAGERTMLNRIAKRLVDESEQ